MSLKRRKAEPCLDDRMLCRIKEDIFHDLSNYRKCFPDLDLWEFSNMYDARKGHCRMAETIHRVLQSSEALLLYVHLPFCFEKCSYCNAFPVGVDPDLQDVYIKYLLKEAELFSKRLGLKDREVACVYFGGGTPTSFSAETLTVLLNALGRLFNLKQDCNITCELHPLDACGHQGKKTLSVLKRAGFNRFSMGVQTSDDDILSYCSRNHTTEQIREALGNIKDLPAANNVDMMIGLPGQTVDSLECDLSLLSDIRPGAVEYMRHGVVNQRVIRLYTARPKLLTSKDDLFEMNLRCHEWMEENGYEQNGSYSTNSPFFPYRYSWIQEVPYLALGARARSHFGEVSFTKPHRLEDYFSILDRNEMPIDRFRLSSGGARVFRTLLLRLQAREGVEIEELKVRFGADGFEPANAVVERLKDYELATEKGGVIRLTQPQGSYFVEDICQLIRDEARAFLAGASYQ